MVSGARFSDTTSGGGGASWNGASATLPRPQTVRYRADFGRVGARPRPAHFKDELSSMTGTWHDWLARAHAANRRRQCSRCGRTGSTRLVSACRASRRSPVRAPRRAVGVSRRRLCGRHRRSTGAAVNSQRHPFDALADPVTRHGRDPDANEMGEAIIGPGPTPTQPSPRWAAPTRHRGTSTANAEAAVATAPDPSSQQRM